MACVVYSVHTMFHRAGPSIGKIKPLFTPSRPLLPLVPAPRPPALAHAWPARGPPRLPPAAGPHWWPPAGPFPPPAVSTLSPTPRHLQYPQRAGAAAAGPAG